MMTTSADPVNSEDNIHTIDERTPLLGIPDTSGDPRREKLQVNGHANGNGHVNGDAQKADGQGPEDIPANTEQEDDDKPIPLFQILLLCFVSLQDPIAYFSIFPFINEMIERTGDVKPEDVGFWSGSIESLFSLVQMLLMLVYGRVADRIGNFNSSTPVFAG